jgi:hypothetical protein
MMTSFSAMLSTCLSWRSLGSPHGQNKNAANQHDPDIPKGTPVLLVGGVASYVDARHWTPEYQRAEALAVSIAGSMPNADQAIILFYVR